MEQQRAQRVDIASINENLATGNIENLQMLPHVYALSQSAYIFEHDFALKELPTQPGILLIRGPRQYGKSTWLEQQILQTIKTFGAGSAFYLNGDFLVDANALSEQLIDLAVSFDKQVKVKRIFIDEITNIPDWETILKRLVDNGTLRNILVITTGSKATDLRRGAERLPGRKGKLAQTSYLFTPISYRSFHKSCHKKLKSKTLLTYLLSGGSPIACAELAKHGVIPEYVIQLVRDWVEGEVAKAGRQRSALLNIFNVLFRFGGNPVGQAKLAREAGLANNTIAQGYIELLNDLGCIIPAYPVDIEKETLILRKPCKYHYMNLLVALSYHPARLRSADDFQALSEAEQGMWYEWLVAQELQRRRALFGEATLEPLGFLQNKNHEIDFYDPREQFIEVKRGKCTALEFAWFARQFKKHQLKVINKNKFSTQTVQGLSLEDYLLAD